MITIKLSDRLSEFEFYLDIKETFKVPAFINGAIHAFESFFEVQ